MHAPSVALQSKWGIPTVPPWEGAAAFFHRLLTIGPVHFFDWLDLGALLLAGLALGLGWRHLRPDARIYALATLLLLFTRGATPHLLDSFSRYALTLTPLWLLMHRLSHRCQMALGLAGGVLQTFLLLAFLRGAWVA